MATAKRKQGDRPRLGSYEPVIASDARAVIEREGQTVLDPIAKEAVDSPRQLILGERVEEGRTKLLVAFLNPFVGTAYVHFLDAEKLESTQQTRERALRTIAFGIGAMPDLPTGSDYVKSVSYMWRGLQRRDG